MIDTMETARDKLVDDFKSVISDLEDLLHLTADQAGDQVLEVRDRMQQRLRLAKAELHRVEVAAGKRAREAIAGVDRYAGQHPWGTAAIAAAAGVLVGLLASRR